MNQAKKTNHYVGKKTLEVLEGANDYNTWIGESLSQFLSSPVLEVGAGIGNITKFFLSKKSLSVTDIDTHLVGFLKEKFTQLPTDSIFTLNIEKTPSKKLQGKFASIVAINVLEHIKDDSLALKNLRDMLRPKGKLVLLVPAKKFAYTKLDKSLGHFRRYEKEELQGKMLNAGFKIERLYFFNFLGLFTWIVRDKISRTHTHLSPTHISLFDNIVKVLKVIEKYIPIPIGISLIVVARK